LLGASSSRSKRAVEYYEAATDDGLIIATFHLGEGIQLTGHPAMWRVLKQPQIESLMQPVGTAGSNAVANIFRGTTGLFGRVCRITLGTDRMGGYVLEGNGWRGSRIRRVHDGVRLANVYAEGDPPEIFHVDPARTTPEVPMEVALIVIFFLLERELRHGANVRRPTSNQ